MRPNSYLSHRKPVLATGTYLLDPTNNILQKMFIFIYLFLLSYHEISYHFFAELTLPWMYLCLCEINIFFKYRIIFNNIEEQYIYSAVKILP